MPKDSPAQLSLFESAERGSPIRSVRPPGRLRALAERLSDRLYMGTSSWSFPGWSGIVNNKAEGSAPLSIFRLAESLELSL